MKSAEYLDQVKQKLNLATDKELAEHFNVTKAAISQYKSGTRIMENEMCLAIALELNIDPMRVIMAADIDRATRSGQNSLWTVFSQRMTATAASAILALGVNLILTAPDANAATMRVAEGRDSAQYKLCEITEIPCRG
jgi:transcriptional regulator with XRE-family HTH domain